jgi:hypothetical protein
MAAAKEKTTAGLRITSKRDGFRRAGREWSGSTDLALDELDANQLAQIKYEPLLVVQEINIPVLETALS